MRYWVQGHQDTEKDNTVFCKTNNFHHAKRKLSQLTLAKQNAFIWDCLSRKVADSNYNVKII